MELAASLRALAAVAVLATVIGLATAAPGQEALFVADIEPATTPISSRPREFVRLGDRVVFIASAPTLFEELWISDGSDPGTHPVRPPLADLGSLVRAGDLAFFYADDRTTGRELWVSDGTDDGTQLVADLTPGPFGSQLREMIAVGTRVFFRKAGDAGTSTLWVSDGTEAGTAVVAGGTIGAFLGARGDELLFSANSSAPGWEIWATDGTASGLRLLQDAFATQPTPLGATSTQLFFQVTTFAIGNQLWVTDGSTPGTRLVPGVAPRPGTGAALGEVLLFGAFEEETGVELWRSDGTAEGTLRLSDVGPGPVSGLRDTRRMIAAGGQVFFPGGQEETGTELWRSDGSVEGTRLVRDLNPGPGNAELRLDFATEFGGLLFFGAVGATGAAGKWISDGTEAGTSFLGEGLAGEAIDAGGFVLFAGAEPGDSEVELWRSDGSIDGTFQLAELFPDGRSSSPHGMNALGNHVVLIADRSDVGRELFVASLDEAELLADLKPGPLDLNAFGFVQLGGQLFFDSLLGLFRTDGTPEGTVPLLEAPGGASNLIEFEGNLYFNLFGASSLYRSDGTVEGTGLVTTFVERTLSPAIVSGGILYLAGRDFGVIPELWRSDGTAAGTVPVATLAVTAFCTPPSLVTKCFRLAGLTDLDGTLYFVNDDGVIGAELWRSDGTAEGTRPVLDLNPGPEAGFPYTISPLEFIAAGERLFFVASDSDHGAELWTSDGTETGTRLVLDLRPGPQSAGIGELTAVGDRVFFRADDGVSGVELWQSDGTAEGTARVADIAPGPASSSPASLVAAGRLVLFAACQSETGCELWGSDGAEEGTHRLTDIAPGPLSAAPVATWLPSLGHVFLSADDGQHGRELWALPFQAIEGCSDGFDNDGDGLRDFPDDPGCLGANSLREDRPVGCGLGAELGLALPLLIALSRRRRGATGPGARSAPRMAQRRKGRAGRGLS